MKPRPLALAAAGRQSLDSATSRSRSKLPPPVGDVVADGAPEAVQLRAGLPDAVEVAGRQPGGEVGRGHRGQPALALLRPLGDVGGQGGGRLEPQPGGVPQPPGQRPEEAPGGPPALRRGEQDAPRVARVGALQPGHGGLGQDALGPLGRVAGRPRVGQRRRQRGVADQGPLRVGPAAQVDGGVLGGGGLRRREVAGVEHHHLAAGLLQGPQHGPVDRAVDRPGQRLVRGRPEAVLDQVAPDPDGFLGPAAAPHPDQGREVGVAVGEGGRRVAGGRPS